MRGGACNNTVYWMWILEEQMMHVSFEPEVSIELPSVRILDGGSWVIDTDGGVVCITPDRNFNRISGVIVRAYTKPGNVVVFNENIRMGVFEKFQKGNFSKRVKKTIDAAIATTLK